jgi:hemerythrin superfamily protein
MATGQTETGTSSKSSSGSKTSERQRATAAAKRKTASGAHKTPANAPDAIELLTQDHRDVEAMFEQYEKIKEGKDDDAKLELAENICLALTVHTQIEEEIFYPAVRKPIHDDDIMDESLVEHQAAKDLIGVIEDSDPDEELFDARVHVLSEEIAHHVKEEEETMFPEVRKTKLDLKALGQKLAERKQQLLEELAGS